eukprot:7958788-Heterocapsa_arctica.AAC.1
MSHLERVFSQLVRITVASPSEWHPRNLPPRGSETGKRKLEDAVDSRVPNSPVGSAKANDKQIVPPEASRFETQLGLNKQRDTEAQAPGFGGEGPSDVWESDSGVSDDGSVVEFIGGAPEGGCGRCYSA